MPERLVFTDAGGVDRVVSPLYPLPMSGVVGSAMAALGSSGQAFALTGTLTETLLASVRIPANTMGTRGCLRVSTMWSYTNNANSKTGKFRLGPAAGIAGTQIWSTTQTTSGGIIDVRQIFWNNATNAQKFNAGAGAYGTTAAISTAALDGTVDQYLSFTGTLGVVSDTITLEGYTVELLPFV